MPDTPRDVIAAAAHERIRFWQRQGYVVDGIDDADTGSQQQEGIVSEITITEAVRILTDAGVDGRTYERLQELHRAKTDDERKDARKSLSDAQLRGGNQ